MLNNEDSAYLLQELEDSGYPDLPDLLDIHNFNARREDDFPLKSKPKTFQIEENE